MLKKYLEYLVLISLVIVFQVKYAIMHYTLNNKQYLGNILKTFNRNHINIPNNYTKQQLVRKLNFIIKKLLPNAQCLIRSLIIKSILKIFGFNEPIYLGLNLKGQQLKAHAWIEEKSNFTVIEKIV